MNPGAIVIGGHFQGLGAVRALARAGADVAVIDSKQSISRFSRYCSRYIKSPDVGEHESYLKFMLSLGCDTDMKGRVIFPTDDETVLFLSRYYEELSTVYTLITPPWSIVRYFYNKSLAYMKAEELGIPIPGTFLPESYEDIENHNLKYPIIIKPAVMRPFFKATGKKVFKADNQSELRRLYKLAQAVIPDKEIIIQEQIPEASSHLYSFCPVICGRKVAGSITARRIRQHPMDFGRATTFACTQHVPVLEETGTRLLNSVGYTGLAEVEFIFDIRDRTYKFLEVNPRIWGWHSLAPAAGVNLPAIAYLCASGRIPAINDYADGITWVRLMTDIPTVLAEIIKHHISLRDVLKSYRQIDEYAVFSRNDPMPFFGEIMLLPYLYKDRGF